MLILILVNPSEYPGKTSMSDYFSIKILISHFSLHASHNCDVIIFPNCCDVFQTV